MLVPVPYLFEILPQFLCLPFWLHPALRKVNLEGGGLSIFRSHRLSCVPASLGSSLHTWCSQSDSGPSPSLCLSSGASPSYALGPCPSASLSWSSLLFPHGFSLSLSPWGCSLELWPISVPWAFSALGLQSGSLSFCSLYSGMSVSESLCSFFSLMFLLPSLGVPTVQPWGHLLSMYHLWVFSSQALSPLAGPGGRSELRTPGGEARSIISSCIQIFWDLLYQFSIWVKVNDYERTNCHLTSNFEKFFSKGFD